jgi:subtilisin-like proprotein convertase family protein
MRSTSFFLSLAFVLIVSISATAQTTFTNNTPIPIGDGSTQTVGIGNPYPSAITVAGLTGTVTDINVTINGFTHEFPDDAGFLLVAPNGARFVLQSDVGGNTAINNVTYTLDDQAAAGIPDTGPITAGTFKPSSVGDDDFFPQTGATPPPADCFPEGECAQPAPAGTATLNGTFSGIDPNGSWRLYTVDCCAGDVGSITGGWSITITTGTTQVTPGDANVDMNGDGKTDWVVARATNTPLTEATGAAQGLLNKGVFSVRERIREGKKARAESPSATGIAWYININGTGETRVGFFGDADSDWFVPEDYDGDGKDDIAVWRPVELPGEATFFIYQSSNNTVRVQPFGQDGDDPTVTGDYDGDGKADPAVFRCPPDSGPAGQCYFFYRGSLTPTVTNFVPWGFGTSGENNNTYYPIPGDYDGDGKYDFVLQREDPNNAGLGQFVLLRSQDLGVEYINWGLITDFVLPGDYDGDKKWDFTVRRTNANNVREHYILERDGGGTGASPIIWGILGDVSVPGDYDGDGRQDIAVWRANVNQGDAYFFVRRSTDGALQAFRWGQPDDYPVANWYVH